jgi:hypothetical protein
MSIPDTNNTTKTPAEIELEDSLKSIRGVGENAVGQKAPQPGEEPADTGSENGERA